MSLPDSGCDGETGVFSSVQDTTGPEHTGKGSPTLTETRVFSVVKIQQDQNTLVRVHSHSQRPECLARYMIQQDQNTPVRACSHSQKAIAKRIVSIFVVSKRKLTNKCTI